MRRLALLIISIAMVVLGLTACDPNTGTSATTYDDPSDGGLVLTPRGGIGIGIGGGMHIDPGTGKIGFGGIPLG